VLAVVLAHRYLGHRAANEQLAQRSEYPWLVAMVGYTMVSLTLIAQPLVTATASAAARGSVDPIVLSAGGSGPSAAAALEDRLDVTVDAAR
jgi:hypothetical protein